MISSLSENAKTRLEKNSYRYHQIGCWIAILLNPIFIITDYINLSNHWRELLVIRFIVSVSVLFVILFQKKFAIRSSTLIAIPLLLISLQNAYVYQFLEVKDLLGQNLNYMALFIGAALFILWKWYYSILSVLISALGTTWFIYQNPTIDIGYFLVHGGLLLIATCVFMILLIQSRYRLTLKTILARLELEESKRQIELQAEEIKVINASLEKKVQERTQELQRKNKILQNYAFINSHKLRAPVASVLGVVQLFSFMNLNPEEEQLVGYLNKSTKELDEVIRGISKTIADQSS